MCIRDRILLGAALLTLPFASRGPGSASFADALFTATSAVCVTGLVVHDTALYLSLIHIFGCVLGVMSCLTHCTTIVLMDHYNPLREMQILQDARCTACLLYTSRCV